MKMDEEYNISQIQLEIKQEEIEIVDDYPDDFISEEYGERNCYDHGSFNEVVEFDKQVDSSGVEDAVANKGQQEFEAVVTEVFVTPRMEDVDENFIPAGRDPLQVFSPPRREEDEFFAPIERDPLETGCGVEVAVCNEEKKKLVALLAEQILAMKQHKNPKKRVIRIPRKRECFFKEIKVNIPGQHVMQQIVIPTKKILTPEQREARLKRRRESARKRRQMAAEEKEVLPTKKFLTPEEREARLQRRRENDRKRREKDVEEGIVKPKRKILSPEEREARLQRIRENNLRQIKKAAEDGKELPTKKFLTPEQREARLQRRRENYRKRKQKAAEEEVTPLKKEGKIFSPAGQDLLETSSGVENAVSNEEKKALFEASDKASSGVENAVFNGEKETQIGVPAKKVLPKKKIETPDQREARLQKKRDKDRRWRKRAAEEGRKMPEEKIQRRRELRKIRYWRIKKAETVEEKADRARQQCERSRAHRERETEEQHKKRLERQRVSVKKKQSLETAEERAEREESAREYQRKRLQTETREQRKARLMKLRINQQNRLAHESDEQREKRLKRLRINQKKRLCTSESD